MPFSLSVIMGIFFELASPISSKISAKNALWYFLVWIRKATGKIGSHLNMCFVQLVLKHKSHPIEMFCRITQAALVSNSYEIALSDPW